MLFRNIILNLLRIFLLISLHTRLQSLVQLSDKPLLGVKRSLQIPEVSIELSCFREMVIQHLQLVVLILDFKIEISELGHNV